jgi:uncharacterized protein (DUF1499 family)
MKKIVLLIALLAAAAVIALFMMAAISRNGEATGLVDGRLARCPDRPNCVCSEYPEATGHFIEPLEIKTANAAGLIARLRAVIIETGGTIRFEGPDYFAATFASPLFGFVDDLEVRIDDDAGLIHFRSASRVGRGDLGANRKRVERLQQRIGRVIAGN